MTDVELDEGQYIAELIYGEGARSRSTAPEPSLLPHLGTYLCHDVSIDEVLRTAWGFAFEGDMSPPWMPLWEATLWGVAGRKDLEGFPGSPDFVTANHWRVIRALHELRLNQAESLATQSVDIGPKYPSAAGAARLAPLLSKKQLVALIADPLVDPATLDPESVRSMLAAAEALSVDLPDAWIDAALSGQWFTLPPQSRRAHVLPHLPSAQRADTADNLATWVTDMRLPPDMRALWVSRIAPFVSSGYVWDSAQLLDDVEPVWHEHIEKLLTAPWVTGPWADVFRAHPESENFAKVTRPHETTISAPADIRSRWQAHAEMAAPGGSVDIDDTGTHPPISEESSPLSHGSSGTRRRGSGTRGSSGTRGGSEAGRAPPAEPRRLQADVLLEDSMQDVTAFVANKIHTVDVSIGRGARVRATADIEDDLQEEFAKTDKDWIVLPVWFHAPGHNASGKLRVPRDQTRNSTSQSFSFTAPANGRVLARIHIMRPGGGVLLQSAILAGDIVANEMEAEAHEPNIELNVDVVAGDLSDPASVDKGQAMIADGATALTEQDGSPVEVDVSQLQEFLA
ncbi:MAG: hypothetical protein ACR2QZ_12545, partial [Woeseiaceae bacterium]